MLNEGLIINDRQARAHQMWADKSHCFIRKAKNEPGKLIEGTLIRIFIKL